MKTSWISIFTLLLVGWASTRQSTLLNAEQAKSVAIHLANDKTAILYHRKPFQDGQPAQFVSGRWVWVGLQGFGRDDIQATVELAADGSTNNVDLQLFDNEMPRVF
jgi:hypothetical protein